MKGLQVGGQIGHVLAAGIHQGFVGPRVGTLLGSSQNKKRKNTKILIKMKLKNELLYKMMK
jgi:hypothetical protein